MPQESTSQAERVLTSQDFQQAYNFPILESPISLSSRGVATASAAPPSIIPHLLFLLKASLHNLQLRWSFYSGSAGGGATRDRAWKGSPANQCIVEYMRIKSQIHYVFSDFAWFHSLATYIFVFGLKDILLLSPIVAL